MPLLTTQSARGYGFGSLVAATGDNSFESISTTVLSATTSAVTISSIPSTFQHLQLRCDVRATAGSAMGNYANLRLNSDSGANYSYNYIESNGSGGTATGGVSSLNQLYGSYMSNDGGNTSGYFTSMIIDIFDYTSGNKYKTWRATGGYVDRTNGRISSMAGHWFNSTTAVSSINLDVSNWAIGSTFSLYGIKNT